MRLEEFLCMGGAGTPPDVMRILVELRGCCVGAAEDGPGGCSCWEPEYDRVQLPVDETLPVNTRTSMCEDCAYRPDSPERTGDDRYACSNEDRPGGLPEVPDGGVFFCHQGMRRPVRWRHPAGITIEVDVEHYKPPIWSRVIDGRPVAVPYRADGTPGERCAGWAAHRRESVESGASGP